MKGIYIGQDTHHGFEFGQEYNVVVRRTKTSIQVKERKLWQPKTASYLHEYILRDNWLLDEPI